jgi:hypothetical protein
VIHKLLVALALPYLLGTVLGGIGLGWIALHRPSHPITPLEERNVMTAARVESVDTSDVELVTTEGVTLRAWLMRPREANGNVVMLLHSVSDNRLGMYGYGRWLNKNHYAVLLPDARGHGQGGYLLSTEYCHKVPPRTHNCSTTDNLCVSKDLGLLLNGPRIA